MTKSSQQHPQPIEDNEVKTQSKALPFEVGRGWTAVPNSIFTVYTKHPDINSTALLVYGLLLRHYNDNYGYAYPSQVGMAINLGVSHSTIKTAVAKLNRVGLIESRFNMKYGNNNYYFNKPCETVEELLEKFPDIQQHLLKLEEQAHKMLEEAEADKKRLAESRAKRSVG